jgi:hypothetical protein
MRGIWSERRRAFRNDDDMGVRRATPIHAQRSDTEIGLEASRARAPACVGRVEKPTRVARLRRAEGRKKNL